MKYDPKKHHRKSTRLQGWDYSHPGAYFVTVCVQHRLCLFGKVRDGEMIVNEAGNMVNRIWKEIPLHYEGIDIDEYIVMPNHVHGIIIIENDHVGASPCGRPMGDVDEEKSDFSHERSVMAPPCGRPLEGMRDVNPNTETGQAQGPAPTGHRLTLGDIVGRFGTLTMTRYIKGVKTKQWRPFPGKLWQRNFHDRIIRNEKELNAIREYIINNPLKWDLDQDNPNNWEDNN